MILATVCSEPTQQMVDSWFDYLWCHEIGIKWEGWWS